LSESGFTGLVDGQDCSPFGAGNAPLQHYPNIFRIYACCAFVAQTVSLWQPCKPTELAPGGNLRVPENLGLLAGYNTADRATVKIG